MKCVDEHSSFEPRDKNSVWLYKLQSEYKRETSFKGHSFSGQWLCIEPDGVISIPGEYTWNGNSPKFSILDLVVIGTPDGVIDITNMRPKTYEATLVHDALYQYFKWHAIDRKGIDRLFLEMLRERRFKLAWLYYIAVRLFGWIVLGRKHKDLQKIQDMLSAV